ncbi:MAG: hypothetical protein GXO92_08990, partial [FCB group bacterium]|nr:hypothetical protein [FCB group bacterium]
YAYLEDGSYSGKRSYRRGMKHGEWVDWYHNKQKSFAGTYKDDKKTGIWTWWYYSGEKMSTVEFRDGEIVWEKCFNKDGSERDCSDLFDPNDPVREEP